MTLSMTAFAREEAGTPWGVLSWELRSVNHRYLEISPRLPEQLRPLEPAVRASVSQQLSRGKIDCNLRFQPLSGDAEQTVDSQAVLGLSALTEAIAHQDISVDPLRMIDVLQWPGVLKSPETDMEALNKQALELLDRALEKLIENRASEGERIKKLLLERIDEMQAAIADVPQIRVEAIARFRQRLQERLAEIRDQLDPARLEAEVVMFIQKSDVEEEIDRLQSHFAEVRKVLSDPGPVGRRLDFLMQELNREANTLGSKASDIRLTNISVELKVLIEQMREQVQNIE